MRGRQSAHACEGEREREREREVKRKRGSVRDMRLISEKLIYSHFHVPKLKADLKDIRCQAKGFQQLEFDVLLQRKMAKQQKHQGLPRITRSFV